MTFKETVAADVETFINNDEFSDYHTVDGRQMKVIIDTNELLERQAGSGNQHSDGIYIDEIMIYVAAADFGGKPKVGRNILLDGSRSYTVTQCINEDGIYSISLEAFRA